MLTERELEIVHRACMNGTPIDESVVLQLLEMIREMRQEQRSRLEYTLDLEKQLMGRTSC